MQKVVVLGTGGTIAGLRDDPKDPTSYKAGQVSVGDLVSKAAQFPKFDLVSQQIAQIDSKDMGFAIWNQLLLAVQRCMDNDDVLGVLITHGTDTMEESAYLLARLIKPTKPVVLTGAMKPFDAQEPDGPKNMQEALLVIQELSEANMPCICVVIHGVVHSPFRVQKLNLLSEAPFYSEPATPQGGTGTPGALSSLGEQGRSLAHELGNSMVHPDSMNWGLAPSLSHFTSSKTLPRVEIVMSHSSMGEQTLLHTLLAELKRIRLDSPNSPSELKGVVMVGPGAGNLHHALYAPLLELMELGVRIVVTHRAPWGTGGGGIRVTAPTQAGTQSEELSLELPRSALSPVKARIALMLSLMA